MNSAFLIVRFVLAAFPAVKRQLRLWQSQAEAVKDAELHKQALASIRDKQFHCLGGSIYSLYPGGPFESLVRLIVALQTISDYLDNLCDRAGVADEKAFRQLHLSMSDALTIGGKPADYYQHYPHREDGGYLSALVGACRREIAALPSYPLVQPYTLTLAARYSELQTYKHIERSEREQRMLAWSQPFLADHPSVGPWEFAAATGSTLGMFMLCTLAAESQLKLDQVKQVYAAYFPWICGLHILLDYFIDRTEDQAGGDLNFVAYYDSEHELVTRLALFWREALARAASLPQPDFHTTVVRGLLAMYLSDPKADCPPARVVRDQLLAAAGPSTRLLYRLCKLLRKYGIL